MFSVTFVHPLRRSAAIGCLAVAGSALLPGCAVRLPAPSVEPAAPVVALQWSRAGTAAAQAAGAAGAAAAADAADADLARWWRRFGDARLDALIFEALAANTELASARARLREARARRTLAAAALQPTLGLSATASASRVGSDGSTHQQFGASVDAVWDTDLSGALRAGVAAAESDAGAAAETLRDVQLTLLADLAREYVGLRAAQRRQAVLTSALAVREQSLQIATWRRDAGLASELDVAAARTELDSARATQPALEASIEQSAQRLALLLGRAPDGLLPKLGAANEASVPLIEGALAAGAPAEVLQRRPDVRAAARRVDAQRSRLIAARAAAYPDLRFSAAWGLQSASLGSLLDRTSIARSLLAAASGALLDGGRIAAGVQVQDALLEQALLAWHGTMLAALREVEAALVAIDRGHERRARLAQAAESASRTLALASQRYAAGLADYRSVLDAERALLALEDQLAQASADLAGAQIAWFQAVGGGAEWPIDIEVQAR